jgi:hypothetical protein
VGGAVVYVVGRFQYGAHGTSRDGIEILRSCVAHHRLDGAVVVRRLGEQLEYAGDDPHLVGHHSTRGGDEGGA